MESYHIQQTQEIKKNLSLLQQKLGVGINLSKKNIIIEGDSLHEYEASIVFEAVQAGFSVKEALILLNEDMFFRKIPIKSFTRRKKLSEVRGRIIGSEGKTKRTLENIANCKISIKNNYVAIIGSAEQIETTTTALISLIKGSKQSNVYHYLESANTNKKRMSKDLGFKEQKKKNNKKLTTYLFLFFFAAFFFAIWKLLFNNVLKILFFK